MDLPYATAPTAVSLNDCAFYHTIDLPGLGTQSGLWDLRGNEGDYLGHVNLQGKRVLELGTASGYLCFAMEKQGAEVVAFDLAPDLEADIVPYERIQRPQRVQEMQPWLVKIRNGYWLSHQLLASKAKVVYGTVYDIPQAIGPVNVATFGMILLHLQDPFQALYSALQLVEETVIVTEPVWTFANSITYRLPGRLARPSMSFVPSAPQAEPPTTWWHISPEAIRRMIAVMGFEDSHVTYHHQSQPEARQDVLCYTVVGKRTVPRKALDSE